MKKNTIKLNEENIHSEDWTNKIDMLLRTLQYLKDHLENGLFVVDGFVGGQRMEAINRIGLCCMALNDILDKGGITLTDKSVPVASPYKLNESQLRNIIKESIKKVLMEGTYDSIYGKISTNPYKPTFDNPDEQSQWKQDNIEMLSKLSDEQFMKYYNNRMAYDDPDMVDAIYQEYAKRYKDR